MTTRSSSSKHKKEVLSAVETCLKVMGDEVISLRKEKYRGDLDALCCNQRIMAIKSCMDKIRVEFGVDHVFGEV